MSEKYRVEYIIRVGNMFVSDYRVKKYPNESASGTLELCTYKDNAQAIDYYTVYDEDTDEEIESTRYVIEQSVTMKVNRIKEVMGIENVKAIAIKTSVVEEIKEVE